MHREEGLHTIVLQSPPLWSDVKRVSTEVGYLPLLGQSRNVILKDVRFWGQGEVSVIFYTNHTYHNKVW